MAVKDLFDTAGVRTTYGSALFADNVPERTAEAVRRLVDSGYEVAGKANLHEFAFGITSQNPHYGTVPNPILPGRTAGGSSGGSAAAVAAGEVELGLGTDTGGSIRIPAACCGIVGFKPTFGLVSLDGCFPLAPTFDAGGPIARDVVGCAAAMQALAPVAPAPVESLSEVSAALAWTEHADPHIAAAVEDAARALPHLEQLRLSTAIEVAPAFQAEIAEVHRELFTRFSALYGSNVRAKIAGCKEVGPQDWDRARDARIALRRSFAEAFAEHDVVLAPTLSIPPPAADVDELDVRAQMTLLTFPANAAGIPALSIPCGAHPDGSPVSLQVMGRPGADGLVLAVGARLEAALRNTAGPKKSNLRPSEEH